MLKHIVLFTLESFENEQIRSSHLQLIKRELEALPKLIPSLKSLSVALNENPEETYDFALIAELTSLSELKLYAQHPEHLRIVANYIKPYLKARACVDFTV